MNIVEKKDEMLMSAYGHYISDIFNILEIGMLAFIVENNINAKPGDHPALKPGNELNGFSTTLKIHCPGVYRGPNARFVMEKCSGLLNAYSQGTVNDQCNYKYWKRAIEYTGCIIPIVSDLFVERTDPQGMISEKEPENLFDLSTGSSYDVDTS